MSIIPSQTKVYSGFDPRSITGCALWLDAADTSTLTLSGSNVTGWADKSGNGRNSTSPGTCPLASGRLNKLSGIQFTGANNNCFNGSISNTGNTVSVIVVAEMDSTCPGDGRVVSLSIPGSQDYDSTGRFTPMNRTSGSASVYAYRNATLGNVSIPGYSTAFIGESIVNGSNHTMYSNGTAGTPVATSGNFGYSIYTIGAQAGQGGGNTPWKGYIYEVIIFNAAVSTYERQQLEGYLANKWGLTSSLPATHPYKRVPLYTRPFQPIDIGRCQLWFDAADSSSLTLSGSNVTQWKDKSGNGYHVTQATGSNQPSYVNKQLVLNGSQWLQNTTNTTFGDSGTLIAVANSSTNTGTGCPINIRSSSKLNVGMYLGSQYTPYFYNSISNHVAGVGGTTTNLSIFINTRNGGVNPQYNINGGTLTTYTGLDPGSYTFVSLIDVGSVENGAINKFSGNIAELIYYNINLTNAERQQVESYLANKWGLVSNLPSTHPFKLFPAITPLFTPVQISGCTAWFDGLDPSGNGSTPSNGASLATWVDKSGNGRNASGGVSPTYTVGGGVTFNGTSQYYTMSIPYSNNYSIFLVATNSATVSYFFGRDALAGGRDPTFIQGFPSANVLEWYEDTNRATISTTPSSPFIASVNHTQGTNITGFYFGTQSFSISQTRAYSSLAWDTLGQAGSGNAFYSGTMKELIFYGSVVTNTQRQQIEGYLANKWGLKNSLPSTHPFKTITP